MTSSSHSLFQGFLDQEIVTAYSTGPDAMTMQRIETVACNILQLHAINIGRFARFTYQDANILLQDVRNITHVLNYDYPNNSEDYVHRIGRTGRAGAKGTAITLFTTDSEFIWSCLQITIQLTFSLDAKQARELVSILTESKQQIDPKLHEMARYGGGGGGGRWGGGRGRGGGRGGGGSK